MRTIIINSMCMTFNHSYGLMEKEKREFLFKQMAQIFDNDIVPMMEYKIEKSCKNCEFKNNKEFAFKCCGCYRSANAEEQDNWELKK